jgi:nucleotide exchange factor SIL1
MKGAPRRVFYPAILCILGVFLGSSRLGHAKEVEVTKEWQLLGENDTIPAGMHVRIDMTTGEKWVKQIDENEEENTGISVAAAVVQEDGSVQVIDEGPQKKLKNHDNGEENPANYDYEMMHRTLSKLPDEEIERVGGLPELPQSAGSTPLTSKERAAFEKRMAEIWVKRQAELKELQGQMLDMPEVLKERIKSIKGYLADPLTHLKAINLENEDDVGSRPAHFVSVLKDLEFLLTDIDMARDFHTLGGWALLVSLLYEDSHVPQNTTLSKVSRSMEDKARAVQAHAAWAIGTAVKNTGEFFPLAIEQVTLGNSETTTAIDLLVDVFCKEYKDSKGWQVRNLLAKSVYAIGALLRGNRIALSHIAGTEVPTRLGDKLRELSISSFSSSSTKLVQRLVSLAGDIVSDVNLHEEGLEAELKEATIQSFSNEGWCGSLSTLLTTDTFLPVNVQETLLESVIVLKPYCSWDSRVDEFMEAITSMQGEWQNNKDNFDSDHLGQIMELAERARQSFEKD